MPHPCDGRLLEQPERVAIAVLEIVQVGFLQRGGDRDCDGVIGKTFVLRDRGDRRRVRGLILVEGVVGASARDATTHGDCRRLHPALRDQHHGDDQAERDEDRHDSLEPSPAARRPPVFVLRALLERHAHRVDGSRAHAAVECTPVVPDFYGARRASLTFAVDTERSASHREAREGGPYRRRNLTQRKPALPVRASECLPQIPLAPERVALEEPGDDVDGYREDHRTEQVRQRACAVARCAGCALVECRCRRSGTSCRS